MLGGRVWINNDGLTGTKENLEPKMLERRTTAGDQDFT